MPVMRNGIGMPFLRKVNYEIHLMLLAAMSP